MNADNQIAQALCEAIQDVDDRIEEAKDAMAASDSATIYHQAFEAKVDLLRDRQRLVEQLEEIGLEDPEL